MISPKFLKDTGKSSIITGSVLLAVAAVYKLVKAHV
jgi:hypothetical protein